MLPKIKRQELATDKKQIFNESFQVHRNGYLHMW